MPINLINLDTGDMDMSGGDTAAVGFIPVSIVYNAASVDQTGFVAPRAYRVRAIVGRVTAAGTDGGAVTLQVRKAASGTAVASGTLLHSGTFNLKGTANTNQTLALSTTSADLDIAAGDMIGLDFTGVLTSATGVVTISLTPR
jgi:hypothetical protein